MKLARRQFLCLVAGAAALPVVSHVATAQAYPSRSVRIVVHLPPAAAATSSRACLDNGFGTARPAIHHRQPARCRGNHRHRSRHTRGRRWLYAAANRNVQRHQRGRLQQAQLQFQRDIVPVAGIFQVPGVMLIHPGFAPRSVPDFIAYAKAHPGKINMASGGTGGFSHAFGELFKMRAGVELLHVPYRGVGPALTDLIGGQVQVMFDTLSQSIEYIKSGRLRALAVTTSTRVSVCRMSRPSANSYQNMKRSPFKVSVRQGIHPPRSLAGSIRRSMPGSPTQG